MSQPAPDRPASEVRDHVLRLLAESGIAATEQRIRVGELLFSARQHLTAEQIIEALRRAGASVSKATVYNTLNLFAQHGLLRQINVDPSRTCFDSNPAPHYHFHNLDTNELVDVEVPEVEFGRLPALPEGTELAGVDVVIRVRNRAPGDR